MRSAAVYVVGVLLACGPGKGSEETTGTGGSASTGGGATTTVPTTSGTTSGGETAGDTSEVSGEAGGTTPLPGFAVGPDMGEPLACDMWLQNCPEGEKCVAWADVDSSLPWDGQKCVPVVADPGGPDDPCTTMGKWNSGVDTCAKGSMCWDLDADLVGICRPLCQGSLGDPSCPVGQDCMWLADDLLAPQLCFTRCDPIAQDCPVAQVCAPNLQSFEFFSCYPALAGAAGLFESCSGAPCEGGLVCLGGDSAVECDGEVNACCTSFCDLDAPVCPGAGQVCSAWFVDPVPPEYADVGVCVLP